MDDMAEPLAAEDQTNGPAGVGELLSAKDGDVFVVADRQGDINGGSDGLFDDDTRILSRLRLLIGGKPPEALSHGLSADKAVFTFHGANVALPPVGDQVTPSGVIHIERRRILFERRLYERVRCGVYSGGDISLPLTFEFGADFRDMFEVRGMVRPQRGTLAEPRLTKHGVIFAYDGLDGVRRQSVVAFSPPPNRIEPGRAKFDFSLSSGQAIDIFLEVGAHNEASPSRHRFQRALDGARQAVAHRQGRGARLATSHAGFSGWLETSRADIALLVTDLETGPYPYAGIPWFSTPFGRDGIITAWQLLWLDPTLAKGVLSYLAAHQSQTTSKFQDAEPGKIMHETRRGEMAALKEIPFGCYYGGVDTTPLFVALAGAYLRRTDDVELIETLWPALQAAIGWVETRGDSNADGLVDYARGEKTGLTNQGWKDSVDSVFHADGHFPEGPIALVEVQGYAFAAYQAMAAMAQRLGEPGVDVWLAKAEAMRTRVEERFWMPSAGYYGIAVDGEGALCKPLTSNAGHLLFVGLPGAERARMVSEKLMTPQFDSGWGLRTLAAGSARFNPMSYHNGSVWPHDTAICVAGMARYGERAGPAKLLGDMFDVSSSYAMRMPELLCGFAREPGEPPIAYPVACMPQAWAAGSVFMMLQACLGLTIDAARREIRLFNPTLPAGVDRLVIEELDVDGARLDLRLERLGDTVAVNPTPKSDLRAAVVLEG